MGTNLGPVNDVSEEWPFADAFKQAREWISGVKDGEWSDKRPLALDDRGWVRSLLPNQVARTLVFGSDTHFPAGNYVVTWKGKGKLEYSINGQVLSTAPGREVVQIDGTKRGFILHLVQTDPADPLRDIHVYMPGGACENDPLTACTLPTDCGGAACQSFEQHPHIRFNPRFLHSLRGYGAIRFMDWLVTNDSTLQSWSQRPEVQDAVYTTSSGVPLEIALELVRVLDVDAWFTVPHLADDDFIRNMARTIKEGMPKGRLAYVEHSNEVWNGMFKQSQYAFQQGKALGLGTEEYETKLKYQSRRSRHVFKLFSAVFGDKPYVRALGSHAAVDWAGRTMLEFEDTAKHVDALAIAPYFGATLGSDEAPRISQMSLDALFDTLKRESVPTAIEHMQKNAELARRFKVRLIAYEGGQHLAGVGPAQTNTALNRLFDAANRDPRMKALYKTYLQGWKASGGESFLHYHSCGAQSEWGRWGAREWMEQPRALAPKFDALMEFAAAQPPWWR
ncbi:MAG TPA: hypothetical protein VER33_26660 [Polyangiaceae bacterium]|nr:hypothetical protein [Polyangiaceae bacterium]